MARRELTLARRETDGGIRRWDPFVEMERCIAS